MPALRGARSGARYTRETKSVCCRATEAPQPGQTLSNCYEPYRMCRCLGSSSRAFLIDQSMSSLAAMTLAARARPSALGTRFTELSCWASRRCAISQASAPCRRGAGRRPHPRVDDRRAGGLRIGSGVQPRVQAAPGRVTGAMARRARHRRHVFRGWEVIRHGRAGPGNGASQGAKHSHNPGYGEHLQRRMAPFAGYERSCRIASQPLRPAPDSPVAPRP